MLEGDEDAASKTLFDSKYVRLHDDLGTTAWVSTKGKDEFIQDIIIEVDSKLEVLYKEEKKTYILINYAWFDQSNINKFDETLTRLSTNAKEKLGKELGMSDFNLLVVVNAKYDTTLAGGLRGVSFREWFYPMNGLDATCTKAVKDYLNDETKKKFSDGLNEALKERAEKLLEKLKGCKVEKPKEIVILYKRKGHNKYRTWGEFTIVGTDYKGYILERPKGSEPTTKQDFMRHPSGKFNLLYSSAETGEESKFWGVTMCLAEDTGYKLHGGDRADYSNGCFLINYNSPQYDIYPEAYDARIEDIVIKDIKKRRKNPDRNKNKLANSYYDHKAPDNPANKLRAYIESLERGIKAGTSIEIVPKVFIIDETEEKIDPL